MRNNLCALATVLTFLCNSVRGAENEERVYPPPMPERTIIQPASLPGETNSISDGTNEFVLFVPEKWKAPSSGEVALTVHFHGAIWFAVQEHLRRGLSAPMIAFYPGEGSGKYKRPFTDPERLAQWIQLTEEKLKEKGAPANTKVTSVAISSYSAGYGAIREILQSEKYRKLITRVVLADSMYADYETGQQGKVVDAQIDPYIPFAKLAAAGEKTFVTTFSQVAPGTYAGAAECAVAIVEKLGLSFEEVGLDSSAAANVDDFPLLKRCDRKNFHAWGYGGNDGEAHMTHARHIADIWTVLDEAKKP